MIRKTIASLCAAAIILPATTVFADDAATYELWVTAENKDRAYAVVSEKDSKAVVAEVSERKSSVLTGNKAEKAVEEIKAAQPEDHIVRIAGDDVQVFSKTMTKEDVTVIELDGENDEDFDILLKEKGIDFSDADGNKVIVKKMARSSDEDTDISDEEIQEMLKQKGIEWKSDGEHKIIIKEIDDITIDGEDVDVDALLKEHGIDLDEAGDGNKKIIIKKVINKSESADVDLDVETDADGVVKKTVRIMKMPETPTPPDAPIITSVREREGDVKMRKGAKRIYNYTMTDDETGVNRFFIHIKGASAEEAANFINEIEDLSDRDKAKMMRAMSI